MAKKKRSSKSRKKLSRKEKSWEDIGQIVGKKVEKEFNGKKCAPWEKWHPKNTCDGGFVGRLLFIIGVLMVLSQLGYLDGISGWLKFLIGAGFALMKF